MLIQFFSNLNNTVACASYIRLKDNGVKFIHENYVDYITTTSDEEFKEQYQSSLGCRPLAKLAYGIVWKGTKIGMEVDEN
jgi:hypothetical protein